MTTKSKLDYLSKYTTTKTDETKSSKKKKKKKKKAEKRLNTTSGLRVNDHDDFFPQDNDACDSDGPTVVKNENDDPDEKPVSKRGVWTTEDEPSKRKRYDSSDEDVPSPPRRPRHDSSDESSPPRRRNDVSRRRRESEEPPRRRVDSSPENSPPRRRRRHDGDDGSPSPPRRTTRRTDSSDEDSPPRRRRRHDSSSPPPPSERPSTTYRDKQGRKLDITEHIQNETAKTEHKKKQTEREEMDLNKGRKQKQEERALLQQWNQIQESSFARTLKDVDQERQHVMRSGDPMAGYGKKRTTEADSRKMYKGPPAKPNRFQILPGYRWDGNDRGNGFEDKVLANQFGTSIRKEEAYKWSVADM